MRRNKKKEVIAKLNELLNQECEKANKATTYEEEMEHGTRASAISNALFEVHKILGW